jgi:hypothetical protein
LETVSPELNAANLAAFRKGLSEFGFMDGQNLRIEYRSKDATRIKQLARIMHEDEIFVTAVAQSERFT